MNEKGSIYIVNYLKGITSYVEVKHVLTLNTPRKVLFGKQIIKEKIE